MNSTPSLWRKRQQHHKADNRLANTLGKSIAIDSYGFHAIAMQLFGVP